MVKERDSSSRGASRMGSIPIPRIEVSLRLIQVRPPQMENCVQNLTIALAQLGRASAFYRRLSFGRKPNVAGSSPARGIFFFKTQNKEDMSTLLKTTIEASLFIQVFTLLLNVVAFSIPVDKWDFALKEILALETGVQIVELLFYGWYRQRVLTKVYDITQFRYYDWFFTTPTMLFSTASYYGYLDSKQIQQEKPFSLWSFFQENANWVWLMFFMNALMLLFGYLQEIGMLSLTTSSILGYGGLVGAFSILYSFVANQQQGLFWFMFSVWSLYGVAAMFPSLEKNISYNVLDIFAKNFYGLFLSYVIVKRQI